MAVALVVLKKSGEQKEIPLKPGITIIGRRPDCDVRVPTALVSRKHCRIIQKDDGLVIQDLGSANGTYVNSEQVMEKIIQAGDILQVGEVNFAVQIDGQPKEFALPGTAAEAPDEGVPAQAVRPTKPSPAAIPASPEEDPLAGLEQLAE